MQQSLVFNERINSNNIIFYIGFIKDNPFNLRLTLNYLKNIPIVNISNFISNIIITLSQRHKFINFSTKVFIFSTNPNYKDFYIPDKYNNICSFEINSSSNILNNINYWERWNIINPEINNILNLYFENLPDTSFFINHIDLDLSTNFST